MVYLYHFISVSRRLSDSLTLTFPFSYQSFFSTSHLIHCLLHPVSLNLCISLSIFVSVSFSLSSTVFHVFLSFSVYPSLVCVSLFLCFFNTFSVLYSFRSTIFAYVALLYFFLSHSVLCFYAMLNSYVTLFPLFPIPSLLPFNPSLSLSPPLSL